MCISGHRRGGALAPALAGVSALGVLVLSAAPPDEQGPGGASLHIPIERLAEDPETLQRRLAEEVLPILEANCFACHGERRGKGGVRFHELLGLSDAADELETLLVARELIESGEMPPDDEPQPSAAERQIVMDWIDDLRSHADSSAEIDPGWFSTRRLNRDEYRFAIRDLLGLDPGRVDIAADLPGDNLGHGFNTIGDALTVSPLHIEEYIDAAERAIELSLGPVIEIDSTPRAVTPLESGRRARPLPGGGFFMLSNTGVRGTARIGVGSAYEIGVSAFGTHGGSELPRLSLRVDGDEVGSWFVEAQQGETPQRFDVTIDLDEGPHEISAHFTNDFYRKGVADRNLAVTSIEIAGPLDAYSESRSDAWERVFFEAAPADAEGQRLAATSVLRRFATRAFARPISERELSSLLRLYDNARASGDGHETAVRLGLQAVLVSPSFLFSSVQPGPSGVHTLTGHELARRLSLFLWSSLPDDELRRLADLELLTEPRVLRSQVRRMLADERADAFIEGFAGQWLLLRNLEELEIDRGRFEVYNDRLASSMTLEALHFFQDMVRSNRPVLDLVAAKDTFLDERMAEHYGIPGVRGERFRRVWLDEHPERGGVLTMAAVLTVTSNPTRTSPVKRGHFVLDQILGAPPPPPPPEIPPLEQSKASLGADATLRDQLAAHLSDATCASCHARMDPIGLAMEGFDAIGRRRPIEDATDLSAELPGGISFDGASGLRSVLLTQGTEISDNVTRRLLTYALGRGLEPFDRPTVIVVGERAKTAGGGMRDLIEEVVLSEAFTTCRPRDRKD